MTAADREGLREALEAVEKFQRLSGAVTQWTWDPSRHEITMRLPSESEYAASRHLMQAALNVAKAADLAAPLADLLTRADRAERMETERDEARVENGRLASVLDFERRAHRVQTERADRLSAEMEGLRKERDEALSHLPEGLRDATLPGAVQALAFSASSDNDSKWRWGHALTIGLAFADAAAGEEWEHGGMASIDVCYAMAAILKCECDSDVWQEMAKAGAARLAEYRALTTARTADKAETMGVEP